MSSKGRLPHTLYYRVGPKAGQPRLCHVCTAEGRVTLIHPNRYFQNLCLPHLRVYERRRTQQKYLVRDHHKSYTRLEAMVNALNDVKSPVPPEIVGRDARAKNGQKRYYSRLAAKKVWRDVLLNHPERIPPGFSFDMLK